MEDEPSTSSSKRLRLSSTPGDNDCASTDEEPSCFEESLPCQLDELSCPICHNIIVNAHVTECGHTYCHECITKNLETSKFCPKCGYTVHKTYPNYMIERFIRVTKKADNLFRLSDINRDHSAWHKLILEKSQNLEPDDIEFLVEMLQKRKKKLEKSSRVIKVELFKEFLKSIQIRKQEELDKLADELKIIRVDFTILKQIESSLVAEKDDQSAHDIASVSEYSSTSLCTSPEHTSSQQNMESGDFDSETNASKSTFASTDTSSHKDIKLTGTLSQLDERKSRIKLLYDDLEECYLNLRSAAKTESNSSASLSKASYSASTDRMEPDELNEFMEILYGTTLFGDFKTLCTLSYGDSSDSFDSSDPSEPSYPANPANPSNPSYPVNLSNPSNSSNIVTSIEFDKDSQILAIGGIAAIIKLYDYSMLIDENIAPHPIAELSCLTKISSISWSNYYKNFMVSGDYGGAVTVWDTSTKQHVSIFNEHLKRCWSVDCNKVDTKLIASGSDDASVKLWSLNVDDSILTLKGYFTNVCGVKFHPTSRYHLAFCSADNNIYYYDLRNPSKPEFIFKGHHDTVSYVKFMSSTEFVSLSTDSTCKLWNISSEKPYERTFKGHSNVNKFVGLATSDEYICCGSENNAIYIYYKGFSKPVLTYSFDFDRPISSTGIESNWIHKNISQSAITAVCWRKESNVILAGNTEGAVKVLEAI